MKIGPGPSQENICRPLVTRRLGSRRDRAGRALKKGKGGELGFTVGWERRPSAQVSCPVSYLREGAKDALGPLPRCEKKKNKITREKSRKHPLWPGNSHCRIPAGEMPRYTQRGFHVQKEIFQNPRWCSRRPFLLCDYLGVIW